MQIAMVLFLASSYFCKKLVQAYDNTRQAFEQENALIQKK
jgi:hypothetical protein